MIKRVANQKTTRPYDLWTVTLGKECVYRPELNFQQPYGDVKDSFRFLSIMDICPMGYESMTY